MINRMAAYIAKRLLPYCKGQENLLIYGLDVLIYTVLSTLCLILIGLIFDELGFCILIIAIYYMNQTFGGGYHASSHLHCFILMAIALMAGLLSCRIEYNLYFLISVDLVSFIVLLLNPCILHPKKAYLYQARKHFITRSRCISCLEIVFAILLLVFRRELLCPYTIGILFSAISRLAGKRAYQ